MNWFEYTLDRYNVEELCILIDFLQSLHTFLTLHRKFTAVSNTNMKRMYDLVP